MEESDDINKAKLHIDGLIKLGKEIQESTPFLISISQTLDWCNRVYGNMKEKRIEILNILKDPVEQLSSFDYSEFDRGAASGFTGTVFTATADTSTLIKGSGQEFQFLLEDLNKINPIEKIIENISRQLIHVDNQLYSDFQDVKQCYFQWVAGLRSNSDLAKDARTFLEHFYGIMNKLRTPKKDWSKEKISKISWNKIADLICKKGSIHKQSFLRQQKIGEEIKISLTKIMKKMQSIPEKDMEDLFRRFVEHVYAIINLIDNNILHQA